MKFTPVSLLITALVMMAGSIAVPSSAIAEAPAISAAAQDNATATAVSGNWQVSLTGKKGSREATMQIKQDGNNLSGSFQGQRGSAPLTGSLNGNQISITVKMPKREVSLTGTVDGDKMSGALARGGNWSATRQ